MPTPVELRCPVCQSAEIVEWCLVPAPYQLVGAELDADGVPVPMYGEASLDLAWNGAVTEDFRCRDCDHSADLLDFVGEGA